VGKIAKKKQSEEVRFLDKPVLSKVKDIFSNPTKSDKIFNEFTNNLLP